MQVRGLDFNSVTPNLLASGGADAELCIWDVAKPAQPVAYPGLKVRTYMIFYQLCRLAI